MVLLLPLRTKVRGVPLVLTILLLLLFSSCTSVYQLETKSVAYQSVRTVVHKDATIPKDAEILVLYCINEKGELSVIVRNLTEKVMTIDQTKSFFINSDQSSTSYYDPNITSNTNTSGTIETQTHSTNNTRAVSYINFWGLPTTASSSATTVNTNTFINTMSNTTYFIDQPKVSLGPMGKGAMSKVFTILGVGDKSLTETAYTNNHRQNVAYKPKESTCTFRVCITYWFDEETTPRRLVTDFYVNSQIIIPVRRPYYANDALREIYTTKTDAPNEPWNTVCFVHNLGRNDQYEPAWQNKRTHSGYASGFLYDYQ